MSKSNHSSLRSRNGTHKSATNQLKQSNQSLDLRLYEHVSNRGVKSPVVPDVNISGLARIAGVDRTHLSRVLNGKGRAGYRTLVKLKDTLKLESVEQVEWWLTRVCGKI